MNLLKAKTKILLLAANPADTTVLKLGEEFRDIKESLQLGNYRHNFEVRQGEAVRPKDFLRLILHENPHIIHFSGHAKVGGILLESEDGVMQLVSGDILAALLKESKNLQCVILNACYSVDQAGKLRDVVPFVIGMTESLADESAIRFSLGFYSALAENNSIEASFAYGVTSISLGGRRGIFSRSLDVEEKLGVYPNINKPILLKNETLEKRFNEQWSVYIYLIIIILTLSFGYVPYSWREKDKTSSIAQEEAQLIEPDYISIEGRVYSETEFEQKPLSGVRVVFPKLHQSETTLANGEFNIHYANIEKLKKTDRVRVTVIQDGYLPYDMLLSVGFYMDIALIPVEVR
ncbi:MAG: CHAT domain-containing protein [Candidatus Thiothrix putei]|uniref:CHAT domain-containing protein n=1 Tax=Candidatus Thiothrix putei TaxID=3080811 RepID=A0AA95HD94_9GAMM|nr:MAG: CHAT domain-containing protein [Candidatus Thiothrix putei]